MSDDLSPVLSLPLLQAAQAQKHVTHNEALCRLEVLVQAAVFSRSHSAPPADPPEGARYLIPDAATGDWLGRGGQIAWYLQGAWDYLTPQAGWQLWLGDEAIYLHHIDGAWQAAETQAARFDRLGLGTAADGSNRLAVAGAAALFTHGGTGGHQIKINKAAAGDTASLLFQTGWGGRAEMGTTGSEDFAIKVSANGTSWTTALEIDRSTGALRGAAVTQSAMDATPGRLVRSGDYGWPTALSLGAGDDLDSLAGGGARICASAALTAGNHYPEASAGALLQIARPEGGAVQVFVCENTATLWTRAKNAAGVWQAWRRQSSQRGSTATGHWLRLPDGTQICRHTMTASASAASSWSYPMAFLSAPVLSGAAQATALSVLCLEGAPGLAAAGFSLRGADNARRADLVHLTATGTWV